MSDIIERPLSEGRDDGADDPRMRELLAALDPAVADGTYWLRFQRTVMHRVAGELARRRALGEVTVTELVSSWARAVVPTALLAAATAGLLLIEMPGTPVADRGSETVLGVEEILADESGGGERIPALLADESLPWVGGALFAAEIF